MVDVSSSAQHPHPRPGHTGPDLDALRVAFDDLLADSAGPGGTGTGIAPTTVRDDHVAALDAAHELLSNALTALDSHR